MRKGGSPSRSHRCALTAFRAATRVYPATFRREFGQEMVEHFERGLETRRGARRMLWTLRSITDVLRTAAAEWTGRDGVAAALPLGHTNRLASRITPRKEGTMHAILQETRTAVRRLARTPVFTLGALLIVALGIGANTAAFTLVNSFLFRAPAWNQPERVVNVYQDSDDGDPSSTSFPAYQDMAQEIQVFASVSASSPITLRLTKDGTEREVAGEFVTASFLDVVGLQPLIGPGFEPRHDRVGEGSFAVLGHRFWKSAFGAAPDIVGQSVEINDQPVTVVGVGPPGFAGNLRPIVTDVWLSISSVALGGEYRIDNLERREDHWYDVKARLAEEVTPEMAQVAMDRLANRLATEFPEINTNRGITVFAYGDVRLHPDADQALKPAAAAAMGLVGLVLLLACSNLANLLLVRGVARLPEAAMRRALGASKLDVARSFLMESLLLSIAGGVLGLVLARWVLRLTPALPLPLPVDGAIETSMDLRVVLFTTALVLITGCLFGLAPALRAVSSDFASIIQVGPRSAGGKGSGLLRSALVAIQVAASIILLIACGLVLRNIEAAIKEGAGVDSERVAWALVDLEPLGQESESHEGTWRQIMDRVQTVPGVRAAAMTSRLPANGRGGSTTTVIEGYEAPTGTSAVELLFAFVGPSYFDVMGQTVLEGRVFQPEDRADSRTVAIVNETAAKRYWPGESPIGRRMRPQSVADAWYEVVGVVADTKIRSLSEPATPMLYRAAGQITMERSLLVIRTDSDPSTLATSLPGEIQTIAPEIEIAQSGDLETYVRAGMSGSRTMATVLGAFAGLALLLASLGIYAVVSYSVSRRSSELGIRIALGAARTSVLFTVMKDIAVALAVGGALGLIASLTMANRLQNQLPSISAIDIRAFGGAVLILGTVALLASYLPARRAAATDPATTLRVD